MRSVRATCASSDSAGWQQVNISSRRSSGKAFSSTVSSADWGTSSSLVQAGFDGGVTLENAGAARTGSKSVRELLTRKTKKGERYVIEREIARGGMGAVLRAVDCDIRREVAERLHLRRPPELYFQVDRSGKAAARVEELLKRASTRKAQKRQM